MSLPGLTKQAKLAAGFSKLFWLLGMLPLQMRSAIDDDAPIPRGSTPDHIGVKASPERASKRWLVCQSPTNPLRTRFALGKSSLPLPMGNCQTAVNLAVLVSMLPTPVSGPLIRSKGSINVPPKLDPLSG